jgi:hypothetical protein
MQNPKTHSNPTSSAINPKPSTPTPTPLLLARTQVGMLSAVVNSSQIAEAMSTREAKRHTQALVKLSTLVTAICKELLACGDKIVDKSSAEEAARKELFNAIVPMLLRCTESAEHDVSQVSRV